MAGPPESLVVEVRKRVLADFRDLSDAMEAARKVFELLGHSEVQYRRAVTSGFGNYQLPRVDMGRGPRVVRPINGETFLRDPEEFFRVFAEARAAIAGAKEERQLQDPVHAVDSSLYTIAQAVGIGLDLLADNVNQARRNAGLRFESLCGVLLDELGVTNTALNLVIPTPDGGVYRCGVDRVITKYPRVQSTPESPSVAEAFLSIKTTSKDRMAKVYTDKQLLDRFVGQPLRTAALFLHDVQGKGEDGISGTFVANNFRVYQTYMTPLEGVYYLDPRTHITKPWYRDHLWRFSDFVARGVWELLE